MTIDLLRTVLGGLGIDSSIVQFGGLPNEAYVIEPYGPRFRVFYSERGRRSNERTFERESDAVDALWELLAADHTIRLCTD